MRKLQGGDINEGKGRRCTPEKGRLFHLPLHSFIPR